MASLEPHLSSAATALLLGIKTPTLRKWRTQGKGPQGYFHVSPTHVVYPESSVRQFLDEMKRNQGIEQ